uniref:C-C motif chemokine 25 n=1 Tax=Equus asinus asinus TaxID=83772 RepID=A0A8C4L2J6_EQUAS
MNPWLLACLVACSVGAWAPTVHAQGVFEDCCLAYHRHARLAVLRHAQGYLRQEVTGSCNLPAVIFFFRQKQRMVCGDPRARWVQKGMKILDARNKAPSKDRGSSTLWGPRADSTNSPTITACLIHVCGDSIRYPVTCTRWRRVNTMSIPAVKLSHRIP